jgi:hypothetical protein
MSNVLYTNFLFCQLNFKNDFFLSLITHKAPLTNKFPQEMFRRNNTKNLFVKLHSHLLPMKRWHHIEYMNGRQGLINKQ